MKNVKNLFMFNGNEMQSTLFAKTDRHHEFDENSESKLNSVVCQKENVTGCL